MSNSVYGYFYTDSTEKVAEFLRTENRHLRLGIFQIHPSELYNYPAHLLPEQSEKLYCFIIGDNPESRNATYLVDGYDYAPIADIALPLKSGDRIGLLAELLHCLMTLTCDGRLYVAITDCDQIERTKNVRSRDIKEVLLNDIGTEGPPDILYCIGTGP
jgi:hypothetical protein